MYEIRTALSYLIPRKGQLSISVVGLIAVFVIVAITWLILVFFSTTEGFERRWSQKIVGVMGPLRVAPTPAYFDSPWYRIDLYSGKSSFSPQRLSKNRGLVYDPDTDPPLPPQLAEWYKNPAQNPIQAATAALSRASIPWRAFESTVCHVSVSTLNQYACLLGLDRLDVKAFSPLDQLTPDEVAALVRAGYSPSASLALPSDKTLSYVPSLGYPALLPKQMRQQGTKILDTGSFQFTGAGISGEEALSIPFYVAGFFDPGILPIGGKLILTSRQAVMAIQPTLDAVGPLAASGIIIDAPFCDLNTVQAMVQQELDNVSPGLFSVQRFDQYEVTSELYQQLASEKTLFRLLSLIIIVVACSNIFSMLFILAHDRRKEIAVLRALGASRPSITTIFVLAGIGVGLLGTLLGSALAAMTLHYLPQILAFIGTIQGHAVLHASFYGDIAPQTIGTVPFLFAIGSICCTSAIAGACAAVRACRTNLSEALRS